MQEEESDKEGEGACEGIKKEVGTGVKTFGLVSSAGNNNKGGEKGGLKHYIEHDNFRCAKG